MLILPRCLSLLIIILPFDLSNKQLKLLFLAFRGTTMASSRQDESASPSTNPWQDIDTDMTEGSDDAEFEVR